MPLLLFFLFSLAAQADGYRPADVVWTEQSRNSSQSMPCGGHDVGMNVWVEQGDVLMYVAQSGWFDENNTLLKAGRWRLHIEGNPFSQADFRQVLCLDEGSITISGAGVEVRLWADVDQPCVFMQMSGRGQKATLSYESWRWRDRPLTKAECQQCSYKWVLPEGTVTRADSIVARPHELLFCHHNPSATVFDFTTRRERMDANGLSLFNPLAGRLMGGVMRAKDFTLTSCSDGQYAATDHRSWHYEGRLGRNTVVTISLPFVHRQDLQGDTPPSAADSKKRSQQWWHRFWQRSWITATGTDNTLLTALRNYELMRFMLGCNARGEWPTKFNGGLFTFDPVYVDQETPFTPDYRKWGGGTMTAQNQRLVYWPMLKSGDTDLMAAQLDTYLRMLPNAVAWSKRHWGHGGACFTEQTENFGLPNPAEYGKHRDGDDWGVERNAWLEYEWDTALEFCMMALTAHRYTGQDIAKYEPLVEECLRFFDLHYQYLARQRGAKALNAEGKLVIYPGSACETYKMAYNPASTIAALRTVTAAWKDYLAERKGNAAWADSLLTRLPEVPLRTIGGDTCIAPATVWERIQNTETPQLYPVFPWRIYGVGRPGLQIARNTWEKDAHAIDMRSTKGWKQDNIWAACLGLTDEAKRLMAEKLSDGPYRFTAFWDPGFDWAPDMNRGGAAMIGVQEMLLQEDADGRILPFAAWPREWDVSFKLHASGGRTVEGTMKNGRQTVVVTGPDGKKTTLSEPTDGASSLRVTHQTCNYQEEDATVSGTPFVGWQMESTRQDDRQTAYQIVVTRRKDGKTICDTGRRDGSQSQHVALPALATCSSGYEWKVRVWDKDNVPSPWSKGQVIRTATNFGQAQWIGAITKRDAHIPEGRWSNEVYRKDSVQQKWKDVDTLSARSIVMEKTFRAERWPATDAQLAICGLGHYIVYINGQRVGSDEFAPLWSEYNRTVYYNILDATPYIKQGENVVSVVLGNGFYNVQRGERYSKLQASFGPPKLLLRLDITADGRESTALVSNNTWTWRPGPVTFNSIYGGESYDARLETPGMTGGNIRPEEGRKAVVVEAPRGTLVAQEAPPVRIIQRLEAAKRLTVNGDSIDAASRQTRRQVDPSVMVFDMGQNLSGFPEINVKGKAGQKVTILVGETLTRQGVCNQAQTGRQHFYEYTLRGNAGGETWHPAFSYYGFRYVQIEGAVMENEPNPAALPVVSGLRSCFVHSAARPTSAFECSNDLFTQTHRLIEMAERSNMHAVLTDCPHREKLGWLEQDHLCGPSLLDNFQMGSYIPKVMRDMADAQKANGMVPTTAPQYVSFGNLFDDSPEWGSTLIILPFMYYRHYGDSSLIEKYYEPMRRYVDYLTTRADGGIVSHGLGDWYDHGPGRAGFSKNTPVPLVATAHYIFDLQLISTAAHMTGHKADAEKYRALLEEVKNAFQKEFYHPEEGFYGTGSQASNALPVFLGLAPDNRTMEHLKADIRQHGCRLTTGDVGNRYLFQALARNGENELLYNMLNHYDVPGYGYQIAQGATTLTEQWDPKMGASQNHFMMGQIDEWLFASLAGIGQEEGNAGMRQLVINPQLPTGLKWVKAHVETLYGKVKVEASHTEITVDIPVGCQARIRAGEQWHRVGSGHWHFNF